MTATLQHETSTPLLKRDEIASEIIISDQTMNAPSDEANGRLDPRLLAIAMSQVSVRGRMKQVCYNAV